MNSENLPPFIANFIFCSYLLWLITAIPKISVWPTPNLMLLCFVPLLVMLFALLYLRTLYTFEMPASMRNAQYLFFFLVYVVLAYQEKTEFKNLEPESLLVKSELNEPICQIQMQSNSSYKKGYCSYLVYAHNNSPVRNFTFEKSKTECIESIQKACSVFCGNTLIGSRGNQVHGFLVNFGPKKNFDEFHWPFSEAKTLALAYCESDYKYKIFSDGKKKLVKNPEL